MTKIKEGIVVETNKEYHEDMTAISKSRLAKMSVCPQYFKWCEDNPQEPTEDLTFGRAFHKLVLEPNDFYDEFAILPSIDRRTKAGKEAYSAFIEENADKDVITQEQFEQATAMKQAVMQNEYAVKLLKGEVETSLYFQDDLTGVRCKARPDVRKTLNNGNIVITDLKSTQSAVAENFMRDIVKYGYDLQAYMYCLAVSKALKIEMYRISFCFIAVEKKAPHLSAVYEVNSDILARGEQMFRKYIGEYKYCTDNNNWYGYNGFSGQPMSIGLPKYLIENKGE